MTVLSFNKESSPKRKPVVAVDGVAASGKGTLAKALAAQLGYAYLDTGALYRMVALATLKRGGDPSNLDDIKPVLGMINMSLQASALTDPALREPDVADAAPKVAAIPEVRAVVRAYQDAFMQNPPDKAPGVVLDGRDIGTVVCPDAEVKFYVTVSLEESARRRYAELKDTHPDLTLEKVLEELRERDRLDSTRHVSPLRPAADAYILDTTHLTPQQTLDEAVEVVKKKFLAGPPKKAASAKRDRPPKI
jgi:cytidylate kinase